MKKKILISGAGVAGVICALSIDTEKYDIDMIEQADSFRNIGFSIMLWKSGFTILQDILREHRQDFTEGKDYFPAKGFSLFGGLKIKKLKWMNAAGYAWVIERAHLMDILERALILKVSPGSLVFSKNITAIKNQEGKAFVSFDDSAQKEYDFVIIAEGIHSSTRTLVFPKEEKIVPLGQSLRYAWFNKETDLAENGALFFTKSHIGVIHPPYIRNLLGYYFKNGTSLKEQQEFEKKMFGVIKQPDGQETSIDYETSRVFDLKNVYLPRYHAKNIVFVGDAAHGRPPTLGFGTSLAIEDSVLICRELNHISSFENLESVLRKFSSIRAKRVEEIYRFQNFIHKFITGSEMKVRILSLCLELFYAKHIERKIKHLASFSVGSR